MDACQARDMLPPPLISSSTEACSGEVSGANLQPAQRLHPRSNRLGSSRTAASCDLALLPNDPAYLPHLIERFAPLLDHVGLPHEQRLDFLSDLSQLAASALDDYFADHHATSPASDLENACVPR